MNKFYSLILMGVILISCSDEPINICEVNNFEGSFNGSYWLQDIFNFENNDILFITVNGNSINVKSELLQTDFNAEFNASLGEASFSNLNIDEFSINNSEAFFNLKIKSGKIYLDSDCEKLYIVFDEIDIASGTVEIPNTSYPLINVSINSRNGMKKCFDMEDCGGNFVKIFESNSSNPIFIDTIFIENLFEDKSKINIQFEEDYMSIIFDESIVEGQYDGSVNDPAFGISYVDVVGTIGEVHFLTENSILKITKHDKINKVIEGSFIVSPATYLSEGRFRYSY